MALFGPREKLPSLYGDARLHTWISRKNNPPPLADSVFSPTGGTSILLGLDPKGDIGYTWNPTQSRGHALCFSATGGGKNTNLIQPALLTYLGNTFTLDPKGENAWITAERRRQLGFRAVILDPWNQVNERYASKVGQSETVSKFNPLMNLDPTSAEFNDDITLISDSCIITPAGTDPHWPDSSRELVSGLIAASVERAPGVASFRDVCSLLRASDTALALAVAGIVESNPDSLAGRKLKRFAATPVKHKDGSVTYETPKEIQSIRSTTVTQLAIFDAAALLDSMDTEPNAFKLTDLAREKVSLYLVLPPDKLLTHGRWMRLIIQLALRAIASQPTPPIPVLFILDELGTINPGAGLKSIEQAYGLLGGLGIRIWGFFQTLDQLARDYPASWQTFIGNSETIQVLRVNESMTADYFSNFIGTATWEKLPGGQWKLQEGGRTATRMRVSDMAMEEAQVTSRRVILPQEITKLPQNQVLSLRSGQNGFRLFTKPYFLEKRFEGMYRPDPNYRLPTEAQKAGKTQAQFDRDKKIAELDDKLRETADKAFASAVSWAGSAWSRLKSKAAPPPSDDPAE